MGSAQGKPAWLDAVGFCARAHAGHLRRDAKTPYSAHPLRVALWVRDVFGCDDDVCLVSAILHDVIEDTPVDRDEIEERFGAEVASCVAALSKDARRPEPEREREYDEGLASADWRARLVKLADVADNLLDGTASPERTERQVERCRRAIALAEVDAGERAETARAIALVRSLIEGSSTS